MRIIDAVQEVEAASKAGRRKNVMTTFNDTGVREPSLVAACRINVQSGKIASRSIAGVPGMGGGRVGPEV